MATTSDADWAAYYRRLGQRPPRPLVIRAAEYADAPGTALDLGCGDGTETVFLLDQGWSVIAVDLEPAALRLTRERAGGDRSLTLDAADLSDYLPPEADLILASAALPFVPAHSFASVWSRLQGALRPQGLVALDLFGDRDSWAAGETAVSGMTFHSRAQVDELFTGLDVLHLEEREFDGGSGRGPKHWHRFEIVARHR